MANELNVSNEIHSIATHTWRDQLKKEGLLDEKALSAEEIFSIVIETAVMTEHELAAYCRTNGLFVEQVKQRKISSIQAHNPKKSPANKIDSTHQLGSSATWVVDIRPKDSLLVYVIVQILLGHTFGVLTFLNGLRALLRHHCSI